MRRSLRTVLFHSAILLYVCEGSQSVGLYGSKVACGGIFEDCRFARFVNFPTISFFSIFGDVIVRYDLDVAKRHASAAQSRIARSPEAVSMRLFYHFVGSVTCSRRRAVAYRAGDWQNHLRKEKGSRYAIS